MAKIRKIYDEAIKPDGTKTTIYPITSTRAVYTPDGITLEEYLKTIGKPGLVEKFVHLDSIDDLPEFPTEEEKRYAYIIGNNIYVYVGEGGDVKDGKYENCWPLSNVTFVAVSDITEYNEVQI